MPDNVSTVTNHFTLVAFPMWTFYFVLFVQVALTVLLGYLLLTIRDVIGQVKEMLKDVQRDTMPHVNATLKNVETISGDAAKATSSVSATTESVTGLVNNVVQKVESPLVKVAGVFAGVMAGARAGKGKKDDKKKGGKGGFNR